MRDVTSTAQGDATKQRPRARPRSGFIDSTDPKLIPMNDVRVRWLDDGALLGHFDFALVHRARIVGFATEGLGGGGDSEG